MTTQTMDTTLIARTFFRAAAALAGGTFIIMAAVMPAAAAEEDTLEPVVEMIQLEGDPIPAEEFNAVAASVFEVAPADVGAWQAAVRSQDSQIGHQLLVRELPDGTADIVIGYATTEGITGFLTDAAGSLREAMRRTRDGAPSFEVTDELRKRFAAEKQFWRAWTNTKAIERTRKNLGAEKK